jgi:FlaA1/EpsC-like NDP-sugar epimerase
MKGVEIAAATVVGLQVKLGVGAVTAGGSFCQTLSRVVIDTGRPVKTDELARQLITLSGFVPDTDIQIVYTGVRPGEKLHEDLFDLMEVCLDTRYNNIFVLRSPAAIQFDMSAIPALAQDGQAPYARQSQESKAAVP